MDYLITEAVALKAAKEEEKAAKDEERKRWKEEQKERIKRELGQ